MASDKKPAAPPIRPKEPRPSEPRTSLSVTWIVVILLAASTLWIAQRYSENWTEIDYSFFHEQVQENNVRSLRLEGQTAYGEFREPPSEPKSADTTETPDATDAAAEPKRLARKFRVTLLSPLVDDELRKFWMSHGVQLQAQQPTDYSDVLAIIWLIALVILAVGLWNFFRRTRDQVLGGGMLSGVTRSPARRYEPNGERITFNDVAGLDTVKKDLQELVEFLKDPQKFQRLGARVPKGVLLMGPPGTGKTLLARAIAGEAGVPFFSISGSEFIQLFVGVGAGRVRDMFKTAKDNAPSILFIDEIDAVGRQRGAGLGGGHDEREQTLNQILSEMDGFMQTTTVIVIAATNRPDVLDPALLRPGRFDRHITVDRPTLKGRKELFEVHCRNIPVSDDVDFDRLARGTVGLTGADIRNLVNEAALWATRQGKDKVDASDFEFARDKTLMGAASDEVLSDKEKELTAYHEAGHALVAWYLPECDNLHKVTIVPRGRALGVTQLVPEEDRHHFNQRDIQARLTMLLAGRAAEKIRFNEYTAGAENDLKEATRIARRMVTHWGMSDRLGPVAYHVDEDHPFLGREMAQHTRHFSEHTAQLIDEEVSKILHSAENRAKQTLENHRDRLDVLAEALLEHEELDDVAVEKIIGPSLRKQKIVSHVVPSDTASHVASVKQRENGH